VRVLERKAIATRTPELREAMVATRLLQHAARGRVSADMRFHREALIVRRAVSAELGDGRCGTYEAEAKKRRRLSAW